MMDVVYVTGNGDNPELRYSLRSLIHVTHSKVWIFGGVPFWVNESEVEYRVRPQAGSPYASTRAHIAAAVNTPEVSDPFLLWNDDFFAVEHVGTVIPMHRGSLDALAAQFADSRTPWAKGLHETAAMIRHRGLKDISYDLHAPIIVHKEPMREALRWAKRAATDGIHLRTLYGNLADLGGVEIADPKMMNKNDPFPDGPWLSSGDNTFRGTVEPVLRYLFPLPCKYEKG